MEGYGLILKLQKKMGDPEFKKTFGLLINELNSIPGMESKVMQIMQMKDEKQKAKALDELPSKVKNLLNQLLIMLNN